MVRGLKGIVTVEIRASEVRGLEGGVIVRSVCNQGGGSGWSGREDVAGGNRAQVAVQAGRVEAEARVMLMGDSYS